MAVPPLEEPLGRLEGSGLISRLRSRRKRRKRGRGRWGGMRLGGSLGKRGYQWRWLRGMGVGDREVRVKARGSTLGEMIRCFVLLHLWVRLPEPGVEGMVGEKG